MKKQVIRKHYTDQDGCVAYTSYHEDNNKMFIPPAWNHNDCPDEECKLFKTCACYWAYEKNIKKSIAKSKKSMIK